MGWRFRRRIKICPGLYLNISKSGFGLNIGTKGANVSLGPKGSYVNTGFPGTGIYRRDRLCESSSNDDSTYKSEASSYNEKSDGVRNVITSHDQSSGIPSIDNLKSKEELLAQNKREELKSIANTSEHIDSHNQPSSLPSIDITSNEKEKQSPKEVGEPHHKFENPVILANSSEELNTPYNPKLSLEHYKYPTLTLLDTGEDSGPAIDMDEQKTNKDRIIQVLHSFGIEICWIKNTICPTITLYEIKPVEGIRFSQVLNLKEEIAMALYSEKVRITPPSSNYGVIGIEVPNRIRYLVSMDSLLNSEIYQETMMDLPCALGKTITNKVFMFDLAKAPHVLIAGSTGQGKSVTLNTIITSLLYKKHPSELKLVLMDPYGVEFGGYSRICNHFLASLPDEPTIVSNSSQAVRTLNSLVKEMNIRYNLLRKSLSRNIKEYNDKFNNRQLNPMEGHDFMPYIVIVIDEYGDFIAEKGKEIEEPIVQLAQYARAVGIHLVISTKRPTSDVITGAIKVNIPTRIAFRVPERIDSQVILDCNGAEELYGNGDMLFRNDKTIDCIRVQGAMVNTSEVRRICIFISAQQGFEHTTYLPEADSEDDDESGDLTESLDPMFEECAKLVVSSQQGSTSMIQRNFSIGYNRAEKIMNQLQKAGIVSPQIGAKPRDVLVQDFGTLSSIINKLR